MKWKLLDKEKQGARDLMESNLREKQLIWTEWCSLPHQYIRWSPDPQMLPDVETGPLGGVMRVRWDLGGQFLGPSKKRKRHQRSLSPCTHGAEAMWGHSGKVHVYTPGRGASPETNPDSTFILDFWPLELQESKLPLFRPPSQWYFVMAAWVD